MTKRTQPGSYLQSQPEMSHIDKETTKRSTTRTIPTTQQTNTIRCSRDSRIEWRIFDERTPRLAQLILLHIQPWSRQVEKRTRIHRDESQKEQNIELSDMNKIKKVRYDGHLLCANRLPCSIFSHLWYQSGDSKEA